MAASDDLLARIQKNTWGIRAQRASSLLNQRPQAHTQRITTTPANPQTQCHLLSLPPELREYIYTLILIKNMDCIDPIHPSSAIAKTHHAPGHFQTFGADMSLLRTCQLVFQNAAAVLYGRRTFAFNSPCVASAFLEGLTKGQAGWIRDVRLHICTSSAALSLDSLIELYKAWMSFLTSPPSYLVDEVDGSTSCAVYAHPISKYVTRLSTLTLDFELLMTMLHNHVDIGVVWVLKEGITGLLRALVGEHRPDWTKSLREIRVKGCSADERRESIEVKMAATFDGIEDFIRERLGEGDEYLIKRDENAAAPEVEMEMEQDWTGGTGHHLPFIPLHNSRILPDLGHLTSAWATRKES